MQILRSDSNLKNSDAEIQQRALEYLQLSTVASPDVLVSTYYMESVFDPFLQLTADNSFQWKATEKHTQFY